MRSGRSGDESPAARRGEERVVVVVLKMALEMQKLFVGIV